MCAHAQDKTRRPWEQMTAHLFRTTPFGHELSLTSPTEARHRACCCINTERKEMAIYIEREGERENREQRKETYGTNGSLQYNDLTSKINKQISGIVRSRRGKARTMDESAGKGVREGTRELRKHHARVSLRPFPSVGKKGSPSRDLLMTVQGMQTRGKTQWGTRCHRLRTR